MQKKQGSSGSCAAGEAEVGHWDAGNGPLQIAVAFYSFGLEAAWPGGLQGSGLSERQWLH